MSPPKHDLHSFMRQMTSEISSEYDRIQQRASEDPGTAGDQGEENWAKLLREWLPSSYHVVTKGRILGSTGEASPQVDVLVLSNSYPRRLIDTKTYLAGGVLAAFECKTTLKASHICDSVLTCTAIKSLYTPRVGSPYKELHSPIVYGLLAHSHSWKGSSSTPRENITNTLQQSDSELTNHPRLHLDLLCVADLATWAAGRMSFIGPQYIPDWDSHVTKYGRNGSSTSGFVAQSDELKIDGESFTAIGAMFTSLSTRIAWEDPSLRPLAEYYRRSNIEGPGQGCVRLWDIDIYSEEVRQGIQAGRLVNGRQWDEWQMGFM